MIKSMTAFGRAERTVAGCSYTVEIRCVNRRYREISARIPHKLLALEDRIKKQVAAQVSRGRVDVTVKVIGGPDAIPDIQVNTPLAEAYYRALLGLNDALGIEEKIGMETLLALEGIVKAREPEIDLEKTWEAISSCLSEALEGVGIMRDVEGKAIFDDFQKRLHVVEQGILGVKAVAPSLLSEYQNRLKEKLVALTEGKVELDPNRLAQEAAFLADKSDITEEIVRAESHLKQFRTMIESEEPAGRALDFLLQELNREVNTIGSKVGDVQISHAVVTLKSELEKIREQVQNVE